MHFVKKQTEKSADRLLEKAEDCFDIARDQHGIAEKQHENAARQHVNADRIDTNTDRLYALGNALTADAVQIKGEAAIAAVRPGEHTLDASTRTEADLDQKPKD